VRAFDLKLLAGLGAVSAALLGFAELAEEVLEGETGAFDRAVLLAFRDRSDPSRLLGPDWLHEAARDITALGSYPVLTLVTLGVAGFLALQGRRGAPTLVLASVLGGTVISTLLKSLFDRPRPDVVPHAVEVFTASFPSGHAMLSAVVYLTLGGLLARIQPRRRVKAWLLAYAASLALLVGLSRIYLGVHWPSDVAGGWVLGSAWALLCGLVARFLQRRGAIAPAPADGQGAEEGAA
jgi:undecaprenyl-diphosphatase